MPDSEELARLLERWLAAGRPVCFLIGGAEGLDAPVIARADYVLSLGRLTWPHFLARVMLAEQVYRARSIAAGHPYHRRGRPVRPPVTLHLHRRAGDQIAEAHPGLAVPLHELHRRDRAMVGVASC